MLRCSFIGFLLFVCATSLAPTVARAAASADVYGNFPDIANPIISPDGQHLAMQIALGDMGGLRIVKIGGGKGCSYAPSTVKLRSIFWANSERLVLQVSFFYRPSYMPDEPQYHYEIFRFVSMDTNCANQREILRDHEDYYRLGGFDFLGRDAEGKYLFFAATNIHISVDPEFTGSRVKQRDLSTWNVYQVDAATGKSETYERGTPRTDDWIIDGAGQLRVRIDRDPNSNDRTVFARIGGSRDWVQVYAFPDKGDEARELTFAGIGASPDIAYVITRNGGDRDALYEFNLQTKTLGRLVFQHPKVDLDGLLIDNYSRQAVGTAYTEDYPSAEYFDRSYAQMQADLAATFPGEKVHVISVSKDRKRFVARAEGPQNRTGAYYLVDMTIPDMSTIGQRYAAIAQADVGQVTSFTYKARDGLEIPAYLTLPPGSGGKNLPLIVMPHGGPHARDTASFDSWAQFLASRGYAVLQPQFRGSAGFGARFLDAGKLKWGLEMQNDVTDGVKHLIANGTADASRVCIFGWSYGGYAAMAGLAFTPDLYKCGVAGAGVSDLLLFLGDKRRRSDSLAKFWGKYIGNPITDQQRLAQTSPARSPGTFRAPILLIHPKDDTVVPMRQSTVMADALTAHGKSVEFIVLDGDDHWLSRASTSRRVLRELEAFLARHLK